MLGAEKAPSANEGLPESDVSDLGSSEDGEGAKGVLSEKDDANAAASPSESQLPEDSQEESGEEEVPSEGAGDVMPLALEDDSEASSREVGTVRILRVYNPYSGEHHYTGNVNERDVLVSLGWRDEGLGWVSPQASSTPVYRLYNPYSGDHHYTTDGNEKDTLASLGWRYEGVGWYSADSSTGVPLYRAYNPYETIGTHHYTTSTEERLSITAAGWRYEGIAWYGVDTGATALEGSQSGWVDKDGSRFWGNGNGTYATGWKDIDGQRYYFDKACRMVTGPAEIEGSVYLFSSKGALLKGTQSVAGHTYLFDSNTGAMTTGWKQLNGGRYYFDSASGAMATGWATADGMLCDFGSDGRWVSSHSFDVQWEGQPNNFFCGPTSGYMILRDAGRWNSAGGWSLTVENVATYMHTRQYGYTSYDDKWFARGMNDWLGSDVYGLEEPGSYEELRNCVMRSYERGYASAISTDERRGGPHYNGHSNGSFSHVMVVDGYDEATDAVQFVDPGGTVLWPSSSQKFWEPSLKSFAQTYLKGIHCAQ